MLLPLKVDRTRVERLAEVPFGRASFEVGALISPRTSCSCCCNNIVEARICSQPGSGCPVIFEVTHDVTVLGLPKGFVRKQCGNRKVVDNRNQRSISPPILLSSAQTPWVEVDLREYPHQHLLHSSPSRLL